MNPPPLPEDPAVERLAQRLRAAHEVLDERPAPKVRAALLEAAARRHVPAMAQPSVARPAPQGDASGWRRWLAWRPRLAATGAALAGVLAVSIGLRVQQEANLNRPGSVQSETAFQAHGAAVAPSRAPTAAPAVAPPMIDVRRDEVLVPAPPLPPSLSTRGAQAAAKVAPGEARLQSAPPAAAPAAAVDAPSAAEVDRAAAGSAGAGAAAPLPEQAARFAPAPAPAPAIAASASRSAQSAAPASNALRPGLDEPQADALRSSAGAASRQLKAAPPAYRSTPAAWLDRIAELRTAGRDAEADEELRRFVAAHPGVALPARVLGK